jgi:hypothetical protein
MKKASANRRTDDLRPEYDLTRLAGGVRGKYYQQAIAGTNLVLIEPELIHVFRDSESVNRALRLLVNAAEAAATPAQSRRPKSAFPRRRKYHPGSHKSRGRPPASGYFSFFPHLISLALRLLALYKGCMGQGELSLLTSAPSLRGEFVL